MNPIAGRFIQLTGLHERIHVRESHYVKYYKNSAAKEGPKYTFLNSDKMNIYVRTVKYKRYSTYTYSWNKVLRSSYPQIFLT